jgi:multicomponent Na+:H+ antiporter subunit E
MKGVKSDRVYYITGVDPLRFILYFFWLLWQILKAALDVSRTVIFGRPVIDPSIAWFRADYDHPAARAILA